MPLFRRLVTTIAKSGSTLLRGDVTLSEGTNVTLTQSGQDISIAASSSSMSIGGTVTSGTTGSVLFVGAGPVLSQDNAQLFWDDTNNRLGVGTTSPQANIEIMNTNATDIGFQIQGAASQSGDLMNCLDSSGNKKFNITPEGFLRLSPTNTTFTSGISFIQNTTTSTMSTGGAINGVQFSGEFNFQATPAFGLPGTFFQFIGTLRYSSAATTYVGFGVYTNQMTFIADGVTVSASTAIAGSFYDAPSMSIANSGTFGTNAVYNAYYSQFTANTGVTWGTRTGFVVVNAGGAGTLANQIGLDIASLTKGGTTNIAIRTGVGGVIEIGNKITKYNNIATVSGGVPSELATVDLTAQAAAVSATTIYTPTASGMFRLAAYLQVTRAATTLSILGTLTITFTEPDGSVAQSIVMGMNTNGGTAATSNSGNTTATNLNGELIFYAKTGVAIQYAIGYTTSGATTMQYAAHLKVEAL